ncbi:ABC transporter permease [Humidisolicoccus flavus]
MNPQDQDEPVEPAAKRPASATGAPSANQEHAPVHVPDSVDVAVVAPPKKDEEQAEAEEAKEASGDRWNNALRDVVSGNALISVLAVVVSLAIGGILIAVTDSDVARTATYFFARPGDFFGAIGAAVGGAYWALFQGSILNFSRSENFFAFVRPITETLHFAAPLIVAGLGVALAFRVGMFNIGGRGQMLVAAAAAGWVSFGFSMPPVIHMLVALAAGILAGAIWGGIAGMLKARTGAHEVIVTIMLNFVALYLVSWLIGPSGLLRNPDSNNPVTPATPESAQMPSLIGVPTWLFGGEANAPEWATTFNTNVAAYNLTWALVIAVVAVIFCQWLLEKSSLGFQFKAVGFNQNAALNAGMNVKNLIFLAFLFAGGFMGIAGSMQVQSTLTTGFSRGIDAGIGFDAITVALLGRSTPWGTLVAGILFGAFKAGGFRMQASEQIPNDIVLVVQSLIVLFIAAPPLIRALFGLPKPRARKGA